MKKFLKVVLSFMLVLAVCFPIFLMGGCLGKSDDDSNNKNNSNSVPQKQELVFNYETYKKAKLTTGYTVYYLVYKVKNTYNTQKSIYVNNFYVKYNFNSKQYIVKDDDFVVAGVSLYETYPSSNNVESIKINPGEEKTIYLYLRDALFKEPNDNYEFSLHKAWIYYNSELIHLFTL